MKVLHSPTHVFSMWNEAYHTQIKDTHLIEFVDVDLTLFVSLWTHIYGSSDQKDVSVIVTVNVMCLEDAAEIRADLRKARQKKTNTIENETAI